MVRNVRLAIVIGNRFLFIAVLSFSDMDGSSWCKGMVRIGEIPELEQCMLSDCSDCVCGWGVSWITVEAQKAS